MLKVGALFSKHGPSECLGNMQELCYRHVHGDDTWLSFIQCLNKDMVNIGTDKLGAACGMYIML